MNVFTCDAVVRSRFLVVGSHCDIIRFRSMIKHPLLEDRLSAPVYRQHAWNVLGEAASGVFSSAIRRLYSVGRDVGPQPRWNGERRHRVRDVILMPAYDRAQSAKDYSKDLAGKIVRDTGNALRRATARSARKHGRKKSVLRSTIASGARVVRACNTLEQFSGTMPTVPR